MFCYFFMIFMFFSPSICASIFYRIVNGFWSQNGSKSVWGMHAFCRSFSDIDFFMHFGRHLAPFWHPLGSILPPFGTFWVHFGPSWHPLGSILVALGIILAPFSTSGRHFGKNSIFGHPISRKTCKLPLATPTKANFRMHPDFPRPGAGILPQATEIRSGLGAPRPKACWDSETASRTTSHCIFLLQVTFLLKVATLFLFF